MGKNSESGKDGISLRTVYCILIILAAVSSALVLFSTFHLTSNVKKLSDATDEYIELDHAAYELMDASEYLTEMAQRFTLNGNRQYMDSYFTEAFEEQRREKAVEKMSEDPNCAPALKRLSAALKESEELMLQEYYAMKLVIEAKGITDYPGILDTVELTPEDKALSAEDKMTLATQKVISEEYYAMKDLIHSSIRGSLQELEKLIRKTEEEALSVVDAELNEVRVIVLIQVVSIISMIWLASRLGIHPILTAVRRIREDSPIPVIGANEFRYLARTYNKMYNAYKSSVKRLNYKASHDELTGLYNRAGYELILSSIDLKSTTMIVCDVDDFKGVNDQHGHDMGDRVLRKIASTLLSSFRSDDYVCRLGGDEFVIFLVHSDDSQKKLITGRLDHINKELQKTEDGVVPVSLSFGIASGMTEDSLSDLFEHSDRALYESKRAGKQKYTFYQETETKQNEPE